MNRQLDCTLSEKLLEPLTAQGPDALPGLFRALLNAAINTPRQNCLNAAPDERTTERTGYANGYKNKTLLIRIGEVTVAVPKSETEKFYPSALERGIRSERAPKLALAEMDVQGSASALLAQSMSSPPPDPRVMLWRRLSLMPLRN